MNRTVLIVGGGMAGMTAALRLSAQGYHITIIDSAPRLGGRLAETEDIPFILFRCHTATWSLLEWLGTAAEIRRDPPCPLEFLLADGRLTRPSLGRLPAPFHIVRLLLGFRGLPWRDRWHLLNFLERAWENATPLPSDLESRTAEEWLTDINQSSTARDSLWAPLSRFFLGGGLQHVSAGMLTGMLRRHYLTQPKHATMFLPSVPIKRLILDPAFQQLTHAGVRFRLGSAATQFHFNRERVAGVRLQDGSTLTADWYIAALPYDRLQPLLPERIMTHYATFEHLARLQSVPSLTAQFHGSTPVQAPRIIMLVNRTFHWLAVRPSLSPGTGNTLITLMYVGVGERLTQPDEHILLAAQRDLAAVDASLGHASHGEWRIVRHPNAFLSMEPGSRPYRPLQQTPFENLLLAGDWTETGWPSSMEGAVLSGNRCAELIATSAARDAVALTTTETGRTNN